MRRGSSLSVPLAAALCTGLLASVAAAEPSLRASLVEARLTSAEDITGRPGAPVGCIDEHNRRCDAGSSFHVAFTIDRTLAGPEIGGVVQRDQISAQPLSGLSYLLVLTPSGDGHAIEWAGFSRFGLCLDETDLRRLGLADQLARHPCARP